MLSSNHIVILDQEQQQQQEQHIQDVHAPAKTYYTTGSNTGKAINRLRKLSVCT